MNFKKQYKKYKKLYYRLNSKYNTKGGMKSIFPIQSTLGMIPHNDVVGLTPLHDNIDNGGYNINNFNIQHKLNREIWDKERNEGVELFGEPIIERKPSNKELNLAKRLPPDDYKKWSNKELPMKNKQDLFKYFKEIPEGEFVEVDKLVPERAREKGIANANRFMWLAYWGEADTRKPINVRLNDDGTYTVLDGNSTYENARKNGWKYLYVDVADPPPTEEELDNVYNFKDFNILGELIQGNPVWNLEKLPLYEKEDLFKYFNKKPNGKFIKIKDIKKPKPTLGDPVILKVTNKDMWLSYWDNPDYDRHTLLTPIELIKNSDGSYSIKPTFMRYSENIYENARSNDWKYIYAIVE